MADKKTSWILELVDKVTGTATRITDRFDQMHNSAVRAASGVAQMESRADTLSRRLTRIGAGVAVFSALSIGSVQFETSLAQANTMAGKSVEVFAGIKDQVQDIAEVVPLARKELGDGLYASISAGVPEGNWISFLNDSARAAVGGAAELGTVVDATATIIKNYGESWDQAGAIQDKFQKTVQLGQIPSLEALASALPRAAVLASQLGVSQNELLGAFSAASGPMGSVAEVGTQLNAVFAAMLKPGREATDMAQALGIEFGAESLRKAGGLNAYLQQLMPRIQEFSERTGASQGEVIGKLFGSQEAIKAVMGLGGELAESFAQNTDAMVNSAGAVDAAFNIMNSTSESSLLKIKNSFGNVMDEILLVLQPVLETMFKIALVVLAMGRRFLEQFPTLSKFIIISVVVAIGVFTLVTAVTLLSLKLKLLKAHFIEHVIPAIGRFARGVGYAIGSVFKFAITLVTSAVSGLFSFAAAIGGAILSMIGLNAAMYANPVGVVILGLLVIIGVVALVIKYWDTLKVYLIDFGKFFLKANPFYWLIQLVEYIFPGFKAAISDAFGRVVEWLGVIWDKIKAVLDPILKLFKGEGLSGEFNLNGPEGSEKSAVALGLDTFQDLLAGTGLSGAGLGGATPTGGGTTSGSGGPAKSITQNLNITINQTVSDARAKMDELKDMVTEAIVDSLRDATIAVDG